MLEIGPRDNRDEWIKAKAAYLRTRLGVFNNEDTLLVYSYYLGRKDAVGEMDSRLGNLLDSMQPENEYPHKR